ncbi:MAG: phosphohistidine phosphatase SixA [Bacillota bacterium]
MNLYLIRHADSEEKKPGQSDAERVLSNKGIRDLNAAAAAWKSFIPEFNYLVSSQLVRAVQTAEIVRKIFGIQQEIIKDKRLNPGSDTKDLIDLLNELKADNIAVFGHEPDFSQHVSALISGSGASINFKKGAIAKVSFPARVRLSHGILDYLIPPKTFLK